jgi:hypothetical protein
MAGGGGQPSQPTQTTVTNTNLPEYARPYVETMLGAGQQQVFNYQPDASGNMVAQGFRPYTPFSTDPSAYFAGFSPMQQASFQGAANLAQQGAAPQVTQGSQLAGAAGLGALNTGAFGTQEAMSYMNPYVEAALAPQMELMRRQQGAQAQQMAGQATLAGAFGGSRYGLAQAQQNLANQLAQQNLVGQGYQTAYQQAAQQYNADQARRLQGLQAAMQGAQTLGQLGQTAYGQQTGNINLLNQLGGQQQAAEQAKINQQIQDYATQQQYPMLQLANLSSLLRGLPMQSSTTQMYQAAPSTMSQIAGLGMAGAGAYGLYNNLTKPAKKGGATKDILKREAAPKVGSAGLMDLALAKMESAA